MAPGRALALALAVAALLAGHDGVGAGESDTVALRVEAGAGTDVTNEQYYEFLAEGLIDTTFLGRRLVTTPEARFAGMVFASLEGSRADQAFTYQVHNEISVGDQVRRGWLDATFRQRLGAYWSLIVQPNAEYRHDRTFDRNREEWRGALRGRLRRTFAEGWTWAEIAATGDVFRSSGEETRFTLDRNAARVAASVDHVGLTDPEWRLAYSLTSRVFPDSAERDQVEHGWEGRWRQMLAGRGSVALDVQGHRRQTHRIVTTSRDNFWVAGGGVEGDWRLASGWLARARAELEAMRYDLQDSTLFFNYELLRVRLVARWDGATRWSVAAGPRLERLGSRVSLGEGYRDLGAAIEFEWFGRGGWWSVTPVGGWREYDAVPPALATLYPGLHSSFAYYELTAFGDQALMPRLRLRAGATVRAELHTDAAQDTRSLYLSLQLRWQLR